MSEKHPPSTGTSPAPANVTPHILAIVLFNFICYLNAGIPLAVVPGYVHNQLGFGSVVAGVAVSLQFLGTFLSRAYAGRLCDTRGSKPSVLFGLAISATSGVLMLLTWLFDGTPWLSLASLLLSRLLLGISESLVTTGTITWAIGRVGGAHAGKVISWNGITSYGAIALGAPFGVMLNGAWGFGLIGLVVLGLALGCLALASRKPALAPTAGERLPFGQVFWRVLPYGLCLVLGSVGFGAIASFITLHFASQHWSGAALALSVFGAAFVGARLLFANHIARLGGYPVALVSLLVEAAGLMLLWAAASPAWALAGSALTGFGFALVFPALGTEVMRHVSAANRGLAVGAYALFLDISLALTGPAAGVIVHHFGYSAVFLCAAAAAVLGIAFTGTLYWRSERQPASAANLKQQDA